jgi:predicted Zn-dependent protease
MVQGPREAHDSPDEFPDEPDRGRGDGGTSGDGGGRGDKEARAGDGNAGRGPVAPSGGVYEWYRRGMRLLGQGNAAAAAELLEHAATAEPASRSVREALARAQFEARRYPAAAESFRFIVEANPAEDYAYFGLGLALWRMGDLEGAAEQLKIAATMSPDNRDYAEALREVRAGIDRRSA